MNNYCKYLKKRKNKPFCKLLDREITLSECNNINSENKCREYKSNNNKIKKKSTLKEKSAVSAVKMHNKSKKLTKLERKRFSVFTDDDKCFVCKSKNLLTWNEIFRGRNRANSMKYGFCLRMCLFCHEEKQEDADFNDYWHRQAQLYFEEHIGSREKFISIFRRNYLK